MKHYFFFQKIYWFSEEWKEFLNFLSSQNLNYFLLSKKSFFSELRILKKYLTGECLIICFESNDLYFFYDFLKKIKE
jgi:hypothetical protein